MKDKYNKPTVNITFNGMRLKISDLISGTRQEDPKAPRHFNLVMEFLVKAIRQKNKIKEERKKLS
jgi:hypothetical protein